MPNSHKLKLTSQETDTTIDILEMAITFHQEWLNQLHESLICGTPFNSDVYRLDAHRQCKLGQWYYGHAPAPLESLSEFKTLESVHTRMHDAARQLAEKSCKAEAITPDDYAIFYQSQQQLIQLLGDLRDQLIETSYSFDPLTGTLNRNAFFMIADKEHALSERTREDYVIAMIDLDHFKQINDQYGHLVGDEVLKVTAGLFQQRLRKSDIFSRFGGEEFIAFLPSTCLQDAVEMFESLLRGLAETAIPIDGTDDAIRVTASAGLAGYTIGQDLDKLIELADAQLYEAKRRGRNRLCYPDMSD